jgi:hypothetical protein
MAPYSTWLSPGNMLAYNADVYPPTEVTPVRRTQIYLTDEQKTKLEEIARLRSVSMADVVRDAVSQYLTAGEGQQTELVLERTFGSIPAWEGRDGVALARALRSTWERSSAESEGPARGDLQ